MSECSKNNSQPPVGMAFWLLAGGRLIDRIEWIIDNGFAGKFTVEVCDDILSGKYFSDIYNSKQTDALFISRDKINSAWAALE